MESRSAERVWDVVTIGIAVDQRPMPQIIVECISHLYKGPLEQILSPFIFIAFVPKIAFHFCSRVFTCCEAS